MRGGKREGAGRKSNGTTKIYRLPIELEAQIKALVENHKTKTLKDVTKSISPVKPEILELSKEQKMRIKRFLIGRKVARNGESADKMLESPARSKNVIRELMEKMNYRDSIRIKDIFEMYEN